MKSVILTCHESVASHPQAGGKARALGVLQHAGFKIPPWFVVLPEALFASLSREARQCFELLKIAADVRAFLEHVTLDSPIREHIEKTARELFGSDGLFAVRSSAGDEDGSEHSFAGQLDSFLFVDFASLGERIAQVWRSGFSERILAYRSECELLALPQPPAVIVQQMIDADAAGVAFGADPISGDQAVAVISSCWGLGSSLVSGECDADLFRVDAQDRIVTRTIANQLRAHRRSPLAHEGVETCEVAPDKARQPSLTDEQILQIAELVRATSRHFGCPQDIEWAVSKGEIFLLQSRPITSLGRVTNDSGTLNIWDNSNIAESYSGVTTPLTFSFARRAYEEVYRQFCKIMRVPADRIAANSDTFRRMIGLIRGRVYYNLVSWYHVLALLPGFTINRKFMEQMMGVKEGMPDEVLAQIAPPPGRGARMRDGISFLQTLAGLVANHFLLRRKIAAFDERLNRALQPPEPPLEKMRADELAAHYRELERQLLTRWDAPLINDFFAMIFHGLLRALSVKWCHDPALHNDLIAGGGEIISAEPPRRIREMAELARDCHDAGLVSTLCNGSINEIHEVVHRHADLEKLSREYLEKFGDRCLEELKLETLTLDDDPLILWRAVGSLALRLQNGSDRQSQPAAAAGTNIRERAEAAAFKALRGHPLRKAIFRWVLSHARARVRDRENLRFERTRLFGRVRRIFVELGKHFHVAKLLAEPRDVFYLSVEEALGAVDGIGVSMRLSELAAVRKREFEEYRQTSALPDRFETRGAVCEIKRFIASGPAPTGASEKLGADFLKGTGCFPGVIRGKTRIITDPRNTTLQPGEILVALRTDPGWIMLFSNAAGLLVEHGSLLSHSAIVAREMGIPAIVAISGLTQWLRDGDWIEMDGAAGIVRRLAEAL